MKIEKNRGSGQGEVTVGVTVGGHDKCEPKIEVLANIKKNRGEGL